MATIGDQLLQPESGWKRYDDTDNNITYEGTYNTWDGSVCYNSSLHYTTTGRTSVKVKFNFTGSTIAIIAYSDLTYANDIVIRIDNNEKSFSEKFSTHAQTLVYKNTTLQNKEHFVIITSPVVGLKDGWNFTIDAIDIDENGELRPYNENLGKFNIKNLGNIIYLNTYNTIERSGIEKIIVNDNIKENKNIDSTFVRYGIKINDNIWVYRNNSWRIIQESEIVNLGMSYSELESLTYTEYVQIYESGTLSIVANLRTENETVSPYIKGCSIQFSKRYVSGSKILKTGINQFNTVSWNRILGVLVDKTLLDWGPKVQEMNFDLIENTTKNDFGIYLNLES